jgi:hypothetical protein
MNNGFLKWTKRTLKVTVFFMIYCENRSKSGSEAMNNGLKDHSGGNCFIGRLIDEDHAAGNPVCCISVKEEWLGGSNLDEGNVIHPDGLVFSDLFQCADI